MPTNKSRGVEERFVKIVAALQHCPGVTPPSGEARKFGSASLRVGGKIFAMVSSRREFVVKLPKARVDALIAAKKGRRFDAGRGRAMREWLVVSKGSAWLEIAREAMAFVAAQSGAP